MFTRNVLWISCEAAALKLGNDKVSAHLPPGVCAMPTEEPLLSLAVASAHCKYSLKQVRAFFEISPPTAVSASCETHL